jgi:hypothetical protein
MKKIFQLASFVAVIALLGSCKDDFEDDIVHDSIPTTPIVFTGAFTTGFNPYYTVAYAGGTGAITITLSIPADNPRSFKSIDRWVAGTSSVSSGDVLNKSALPPYDYTSTPANPGTMTPIPATGKTVVLTTSITEYNSKDMPLNGSNGKPQRTIIGSSKIPAGATTALGGLPASPPTFNVPYQERAFMFSVTLDDGTTVIPEQVRIRVTY